MPFRVQKVPLGRKRTSTKAQGYTKKEYNSDFGTYHTLWKEYNFDHKSIKVHQKEQNTMQGPKHTL